MGTTIMAAITFGTARNRVGSKPIVTRAFTSSFTIIAVFEKFYRGQSPGRGSGLGLAICRGFVEVHGGRIWAENREGGGAAFRFTIPLAEHPPAIEVTDG